MSCSQHIGGLVAARSALCELWLHGYGFCSLKQPIVLVVLVALSWSVEKAHFLQRQSEKDPHFCHYSCGSMCHISFYWRKCFS